MLAQVKIVLAASEGTFGGISTSYYDLWLVENDKIAGHWDVMRPVRMSPLDRIKKEKLNADCDAILSVTANDTIKNPRKARWS